MGKPCVSKRSNPKTAKEKGTSKPPIKVVHISNPMKVNISASEFMAQVQKLTGQDSHHGEISNAGVCEETVKGCVPIASEAPLPESSIQVVECSDPNLWDDAFVSEILAEGFNGFFSPLFYEAQMEDNEVRLQEP